MSRIDHIFDLKSTHLQLEFINILLIYYITLYPAILVSVNKILDLYPSQGLTKVIRQQEYLISEDDKYTSQNKSITNTMRINVK